MKGFELQFHWMFVLIAGALILGFFFSITLKQQSISQEKLELTLATDIDDILTSAIISKGVAQTFPVPPSGLGFHCSEFCECTFTIRRAQKPFNERSLFAPALLKDQNIVVWSLPFELPYRITNFLYLTNPTIRYYFVTTQAPKSVQLAKQLTERLPPFIVHQTIPSQNLSQITAQEFAHTTFVFLYPTADTFELDTSFRRASASGIAIDDFGVTFYENTNAQLNRYDVTSYVGLPSLYAAVFSDDSTMYRCGLQNAFLRLNFLSQLYAERAQQLQLLAIDNNATWCDYGAITDCSQATPSTLFGMLCTQQTLARDLSTRLDEQQLAQLSVLKSRLDTTNRNLIQQSCTALY